MASTYTLISSQVLASSAASVTFSSIPATYTDLVLRVSGRTDVANTVEELILTFNSDTGANYSVTRLVGSGSAATSSTRTTMNSGYIDGSTATSSTFGSVEIYIPSYLSTTSKPMSSFGVQENNLAAGYMSANAQLYRNTSALSSIAITGSAAGNFVQYSSFYLYGISNA